MFVIGVGVARDVTNNRVGFKLRIERELPTEDSADKPFKELRTNKFIMWDAGDTMVGIVVAIIVMIVFYYFTNK